MRAPELEPEKQLPPRWARTLILIGALVVILGVIAVMIYKEIVEP